MTDAFLNKKKYGIVSYFKANTTSKLQIKGFAEG